MITGGATTVTLAFEVFPVPPFDEVTWTLLFFTPVVVPCTVIENVHDAFAANDAADRLAWLEPVAAAAVPPQVFAKLLGVATSKPAGKLSVNAMLVNATPAF